MSLTQIRQWGPTYGWIRISKDTGKKQLCDSLTRHPLFYIKKITSLKTVLSVLRGVYVEKSTQGEKDFGSSLTNTIKKRSLWAIFNSQPPATSLWFPWHFRISIFVFILPQFKMQIRTQLVNLVPTNPRNNVLETHS